MDKLGACDIAAQNVSVGGIAKRDRGVIAATAELSSNKELACIASKGLVSTHQLALNEAAARSASNSS